MWQVLNEAPLCPGPCSLAFKQGRKPSIEHAGLGCETTALTDPAPVHEASLICVKLRLAVWALAFSMENRHSVNAHSVGSKKCRGVFILSDLS